MENEATLAIACFDPVTSHMRHNSDKEFDYTMITDNRSKVTQFNGVHLSISPTLMKWLLKGNQVLVHASDDTTYTFNVDMELPELMILVAEVLDEYTGRNKSVDAV